MRIIDEGIYAFDDEGVIVRIPPEMSTVIPRRLELEWSPDMWRQENFQPLRLVINIEFIDRNNPDKNLQDFEYPIQIQVYYTSRERAAALKQRGPNPLAYWRNNQWKVIPEVAEVYPVLSPGWAGFLQFEITSWGDPSIALGS